MYCVKYENSIKPYFGFIRPYNAVRDSKSYSLTYLPPSVIDGITEFLELSGKIVRHKLLFYPHSMDREMVKIPSCLKKDESTIYERYCLINPELILGFELYDDALIASKTPIYLGQSEFIIYPSLNFDRNNNSPIVEVSDNDFTNLVGVETFQTDKDDYETIFCGFNRFRNNEKMLIKIDRKEWDL